MTATSTYAHMHTVVIHILMGPGAGKNPILKTKSGGMNSIKKRTRAQNCKGGVEAKGKPLANGVLILYSWGWFVGHHPSTWIG